MPTNLAEETLPSDGTRTEPTVPAKRGFSFDRLAIPLALVLLAVLTVPRLPPGICSGDSGDLQVAAVTLGMAHPPGYAGLASVGHLLTLIPGLEPAYAVTLGCLASGLIALAFIAGLQIRLGVNPWLAAAVALVLASNARVWEALVVPEVYAPNLALHAAAAWFLLTYLQTGRLRRLAVTALLLGLALANRPSTVLSIPGFVLAVLVYWWQNRPARSRWAAATTLCVAGLLLPCVYTLGYYYVRDNSETPVNMIENRRLDYGDLPSATDGPAAKIERALWLATAREFKRLLGGTWPLMSGRARWLVQRLGLSSDQSMIAVTFVTVIGGALAWRRCRSTTLALLGVALGAVAFIFAYQVYDTAADVLPIILAAGVFIGLCASALLPGRTAITREALSMSLFIVAGFWTASQADQPVTGSSVLDASHSVPAAEVQNLPYRAALLSDWMNWPAVRYAQHRLGRNDLLIAIPKHRSALAVRLHDGGSGRPVFSTMQFSPPPGYQITPWGELWRFDAVEPPPGEADGTAPPEREEAVSEGGDEQ